MGNGIRLRLASSDDAQHVAEWSEDPEYLGEFSNTWHGVARSGSV